MVTPVHYINNYVKYLAQAITDTSTSMQLADSMDNLDIFDPVLYDVFHGYKFYQDNTSTQYYVSYTPKMILTIIGTTGGIETSHEVVEVTGYVSGDLLITRQNPQNWPAGTKVECRITAQEMNRLSVLAEACAEKLGIAFYG